MNFPWNFPFTFASEGGEQPASQIDANFQWIPGGVVTPYQYGAVGNGSTDDSAALALAAAGAVAKNAWLDLQGLTYAVSGWVVALTAGQILRVRHGALLGLNANTGSAITMSVTGDGTTGVQIENLYINRGGDGSSNNQNNLNHSFGLSITSHLQVTLQKIEVTGNNAGTGLKVDTCAKAYLRNCWAHGIRYNFSGNTDDTVQGIWANNCTEIDIGGCAASDMGRTNVGNAVITGSISGTTLTVSATSYGTPSSGMSVNGPNVTASPNVVSGSGGTFTLDTSTSASSGVIYLGTARDQYSRGIVVSGCTNISVHDNHVWRVDQAFDTTGSNGSGNMSITGNTVWQVLSNGIKVADTSVGVTIVGNAVAQSGLDGVVIGGTATGGAVQNVPDKIIISSNILRNTGSCGYYEQTNTTGGVRLDRQDSSSPYNKTPWGVQIQNNVITSDQGNNTFTVGSDGMTLTLPNTPLLSLQSGVRVQLSTSGSLPSPLQASTNYWLIDIPGTAPPQVQLAYSSNNAQDGIPITGISGGSGTQTLTLFSDMAYGVYADALQVNSASPNLAKGNQITGYITASINTGTVANPTAQANRSSQSIANDGSFHDVIANNTVTDTFGMYNASTGVITIPFDGLWAIYPSLAFAPDANGWRGFQYVLNTGSGYAATPQTDYRTNAGSAVATTIGTPYAAWRQAGDLLKLQAAQNSSTGALNLLEPEIFVTLLSDYQAGANGG